MTSICPWCAAIVVGHPALCPACDLMLSAGPDQPELPIPSGPAAIPWAMPPDVPDLPAVLPPGPLPAQTEPAAPRDRPKAAAHGWRRLLPLACFIAGGALALAVEAQTHIFLGPSADPQPSAQARDQAVADLSQRGQAAVLGQFTFPKAVRITNSFMITTAGGLMSVCGTLHPRDETDAAADIRFLSVNGDPERTFLDISEPSFAVLWGRLCIPNSGAW